MKYLVLLIVIIVGIHWIRQQRAAASHDAAAARTTPNTHTNEAQWMIECPVCGTHLPESDAVRGQRHLYCSVAHRQQTEG
jgi:uncharacterized protein